MKRKVYLSKMRTEIGMILILSNYTFVNRPTRVWYARKGGRSVFFIIREKDAMKLKSLGYEIYSTIVDKDHNIGVYVKDGEVHFMQLNY